MRSELTDDSADRGRREEAFLGLRAMRDYDLSASLVGLGLFASGRGNEKQRNSGKIALVPFNLNLKPGYRFWGEEVSSKPSDG
jgi:hypothetical protein